MNIYLKNIYILLTLLALGGCQIGVDDPEWVYNVDNQFELDFKEVLSESERNLQFSITALDPVECDSSQLVISSLAFKSTFNLEVNDVVNHAECTGSGSFPQGAVEIGLQRKRYDFNINILDFINHSGEFSITDSEYNISITDSPGLIIPQVSLKRIPDNFIWGYFKIANMSEAEAVNAFIERENWKNVNPQSLEVGEYSYFNILENGTIELKEDIGGGTIKTFGIPNVYIDEAGQLFQSFKSQHPNIEAKCFASNGLVF